MAGAPATDHPPPPPPPDSCRCHFWLPNKRRHCANSPLPSSDYCGNHVTSSSRRRVPCPLDPNHSILEENLEVHIKKCPCKKQADALELQPYYSKGINAGDDDVSSLSSAAKRAAIYKLGAAEFRILVDKIKSVHSSVVIELRDSYLGPDSCDKWLSRQIDRKLPYQEKHVVQQASILGNMEAFGMLQRQDEESGVHACVEECDELGRKRSTSAVVEFGAGRGYLTQMLADCYGIKKIFLVERRSYKLKADRSLRQKESIALERLRIDIEDLNLQAIEGLQGVQYLAIGKHLCGPATDLTMRCCIQEQASQVKKKSVGGHCLQGLALATCCHHLCQWKHYTNKKFLISLGITKEEFDAMTWFSSWAVDGDHTFKEDSVGDELPHEISREPEDLELPGSGIEKIIRSIPAGEKDMLGLMCKEIIDTGRLLWLREKGLDADLVNYVPSSISPENRLLIAKHTSQF